MPESPAVTMAYRGVKGSFGLTGAPIWWVLVGTALLGYPAMSRPKRQPASARSMVAITICGLVVTMLAVNRNTRQPARTRLFWRHRSDSNDLLRVVELPAVDLDCQLETGEADVDPVDAGQHLERIVRLPTLDARLSEQAVGFPFGLRPRLVAGVEQQGTRRSTLPPRQGVSSNASWSCARVAARVRRTVSMALPPSVVQRSIAVRAGDVHRIPWTVVTSSGGTRRLVMTMPRGRARRLGAAAST